MTTWRVFRELLADGNLKYKRRDLSVLSRSTLYFVQGKGPGYSSVTENKEAGGHHWKSVYSW